MNIDIKLSTDNLSDDVILYIAKEQYDNGLFSLSAKTGVVSFSHSDDANICKKIKLRDLIRDTIEDYEGDKESIESLRKIVLRLAELFDNE